MVLGAKHKISIENYLFPIYYWGFTFLNPIVSKAGNLSTIILLVFALFIFALWLLYVIKNDVINIVVFIAFGILAIFIMDFAARTNSKSFEYIYKYIYSGFLIIIFVSIINDSREVLKVYSVLSVIAFILFFYDPFLDYPIFDDYMGYGFNLTLPSFIGMGIGLFYFKRKILIIPILGCLFMLLIYSNRGAFLAAVVFVLIYLLFIHKNRLFNWAIFLLSSIIVMIFINEILIAVNNVLSRFNLSSYSLRQLINYIESGDLVGFFSGRIIIWENAWRLFLSKPVLGYGLGYFEAKYNSYPHNIILDILVSYGILGLFTIGSLIVFSLIKFFNYKKSDKFLGLALLCLWFPKLLFSISFVWDKGFWAFIAFGFVFFNKKDIKRVIDNGKP